MGLSSAGAPPNNPNFLWLSAPGPPLFTGDLQSWIRNDNLAPDWSRIGTDITGPVNGKGTFNASFSLSGVTGAESIIDELVPCSGPASGGTWKNHGQYVSSVAHAANRLANLAALTRMKKVRLYLPPRDQTAVKSRKIIRTSITKA